MADNTWDEDLHPRAADGKFASKGEAASKSSGPLGAWARRKQKKREVIAAREQGLRDAKAALARARQKAEAAEAARQRAEAEARHARDVAKRAGANRDARIGRLGIARQDLERIKRERPADPPPPPARPAAPPAPPRPATPPAGNRGKVIPLPHNPSTPEELRRMRYTAPARYAEASQRLAANPTPANQAAAAVAAKNNALVVRTDTARERRIRQAAEHAAAARGETMNETHIERAREAIRRAQRGETAPLDPPTAPRSGPPQTPPARGFPRPAITELHDRDPDEQSRIRISNNEEIARRGLSQPEESWDRGYMPDEVSARMATVFGSKVPRISEIEKGYDVGNGLTTKLTSMKPNGGHGLIFSFAIKDSSGAEVGSFRRRYTKSAEGDLIVEHMVFTLDKQQPPGVGESMLRNSLAFQRALGAKYVDVHAAGDERRQPYAVWKANFDKKDHPDPAVRATYRAPQWNGTYTWASFGFDWHPTNRETTIPDRDSLSRSFADYLHGQHGIPRSEANTIADRLKDSPQNIARFKTKDGKIAGKHFLADWAHWWWGRLHVSDPNSRSFKNANARLGFAPDHLPRKG